MAEATGLARSRGEGFGSCSSVALVPQARLVGAHLDLAPLRRPSWRNRPIRVYSREGPQHRRRINEPIDTQSGRGSACDPADEHRRTGTRVSPELAAERLAG